MDTVATYAPGADQIWIKNNCIVHVRKFALNMPCVYFTTTIHNVFIADIFILIISMYSLCKLHDSAQSL